MRFHSAAGLLAGLAVFACPGAYADNVPPSATSHPVPAAASVAPVISADLDTVTVAVRRFNLARDGLNPETGTSSYRFDTLAIVVLPQGFNAPLQDLLLQAPGVVQDSFGQLHVRGDHADLQYRINGVILPEAIGGFGDTLGTRFIDKLDFLTGALPAQYGYRTAGIVNITTNNGLQQNGGTVDFYDGSHYTFQPSVDYGGTAGKLDYYVTGTYLQSNAGIESPTAGNPIHDRTEQNRAFGYGSYLLNPDLRLSVIAGHSLGNFQIPNNPDLTPAYQLQGINSYPSTGLNETQRELNDYGIMSLQGIRGALNYQVSFFSRYSSTGYKPDPIGDLIYNGVAAQVFHRNIATGIQEDTSYMLDTRHTLRWGLFLEQERTTSNNTAAVFPVDAARNQVSYMPLILVNNHHKIGELYGVYLQDQWSVSGRLTLNYGLRYDLSNGYLREDQLSPRVNFVYALDEATQLHGGYARYFTPPTLELIAPADITRFRNTTNALPSDVNTEVRAERDNYYDLGITHAVTSRWQLGLDAYYKDARNLLDEGQFGEALVFLPFNYARGRIWGIELSTSHEGERLSSYLNVAYSRALGNQVVSGQYNFDVAELAYIASHYVHLDHDQAWTASGGMAWSWQGTRFSLDGIFGSGLRAGFANTASLSSYAQFDAGMTRALTLPGIGEVALRAAVVNVLDRVYRIRDGSGIGVGAPQYAPRRGVFLGLTKSF